MSALGLHAARVEGLRQRLSQRDLAVLGALHRVRLLSLNQLQRLVVADGSPAARTRRAQLLMQRLHRHGLVVRLSRVVGGIRAGSSGYIYGLTGLGQAVIDAGGPLGGRRRRIWESKPYFQDHLLAVSELYVQLVEQHRLGEADLLAFDAEPGCWRHFTGSGGELVVVKPDAYVRLGVAAVERSAFIEVDLTTETLPTIRRKCDRYVAYWRSGVEQQWRGVFPKVVWLVQNERRAERIGSVIRKLASDAQTLFEVGLLSGASGLLSGIPQGAAA
ncbi:MULTISPECIES: replication-relaxation family protein [unclassified Streptomyces]|uniref:Replication-relaxation family protein n=1 Tax=Streptomyces sp. NBC_00060 TaxID=2975636 RepID=A0AAU2GWS3_9ACTN